MQRQEEDAKYPTAHAGVDITNALVNPGKQSRHDVETDRHACMLCSISCLYMHTSVGLYTRADTRAEIDEEIQAGTSV